MDFNKTDQTYDANSGNREPAVVTGNDTGDGTSYDGSSSNLEKAGMPEGSTAQQFLTQLQSDFTVMAKSVARYGGFYISRYEIGRETVEEVEVATSKKGQPVLTAAISNGAGNWYGLYKTIKNSGTNKQMIWGCQYDQVIKFLKEKGEDPETGHNYISITRALSGQNEQDCMRNIYDLEGNYVEWTAEEDASIFRVPRGNYYGSALSGRFYPASDRGGSYPTNSYDNFSSRSTLYM